jgi:hypothetical protein
MEFSDKINFLKSISIAAIITFLLTFLEIWQLIIIPGIVAGIISKKKMKYGIFSGAIGVLIVWLIYILYAMETRNAYINLDQFAAIIIGDFGYGYMILLLILLFGILFGALGGAIGSSIRMLIDLNSERVANPENVSKVKEK